MFIGHANVYDTYDSGNGAKTSRSENKSGLIRLACIRFGKQAIAM